MRGAFLLLPAFVIVCVALFFSEAVAGDCGKYGIEPATFPEVLPTLGGTACATSENRPGGNQVIDQDFEVTGLTLAAYKEYYRASLQKSGWGWRLKRKALLCHIRRS